MKSGALLTVFGGLKKYLPSILYTILGIIALFMLYKLIIRLKASGLIIGGIAADKAENQAIAGQTGISTSRVQELRTVAYNLSTEMETNKDQTWWWGAVHNVIWDSDIMKIVNAVKSSQEMVIVKNFYNNIFTQNHDLYTDLQSELSQSNLNNVPFIDAIR